MHRHPHRRHAWRPGICTGGGGRRGRQRAGAGVRRDAEQGDGLARRSPRRRVAGRCLGVTRSFWAPPALVALGGLALIVSTGADWVTVAGRRAIGGVPVGEPISAPGTDFASTAIVAGMLAVVLAVLLAVLRRTVRRIVAAAAAAVGVSGVYLVVRGVAYAASQGPLTAAPWVALAAAVALVAGGGLAIASTASPRPRGRYVVPREQAGDDEWMLAATDEDEPTGSG
ncbi:MAG: hypothetical protein GEU74_13415 [Nitriliruptorales bacterium]|nr:hypothetical protein [Nitriliruptorales bacterium]